MTKIIKENGITMFAPESRPGYFDEPDDFNDDGICDRCGGDGVIITCCDDLCVGAGECMHGDGEIVCPKCGGDY